jgi:hypothetical protein
MSELSHAAQMVINAAIEAGGGYGYASPVLHARLAAALRTAADQLEYKLLNLEVVDCSQLRLLADELEAQ